MNSRMQIYPVGKNDLTYKKVKILILQITKIKFYNKKIIKVLDLDIRKCQCIRQIPSKENPLL